jgi:hypothetical protein
MTRRRPESLLLNQYALGAGTVCRLSGAGTVCRLSTAPLDEKFDAIENPL